MRAKFLMIIVLIWWSTVIAQSPHFYHFEQTQHKKILGHRQKTSTRHSNQVRTLSLVPSAFQYSDIYLKQGIGYHWIHIRELWTN